MCVKRALASSAALAASRGRINTLGTDSIAAMDRISLEHLRAAHGAGAPRRQHSRGVLQQGVRAPVHLRHAAELGGDLAHWGRHRPVCVSDMGVIPVHVIDLHSVGADYFSVMVPAALVRCV